MTGGEIVSKSLGPRATKALRMVPARRFQRLCCVPGEAHRWSALHPWSAQFDM
jgi:hypothetical protein